LVAGVARPSDQDPWAPGIPPEASPIPEPLRG